MRVAQQRDGARVRDERALRTGDQLVEERQCVARRAPAGPHDEREHPGLDRDALGLAQRLDVVEHRRGRDETEGVVMRPRADRADDLFGLGRREDELHVVGRLLDELQQGVEALRRDHVGLVEDEDLEPVARGGEHRPLAQVACVVDAVVARRVDLDHVERTAAVTPELDAAVAHAARHVGGALGAVEAARQDARRRRLAAPARSGEEVGVPDAVAAQRGHEGLGHLGLPDHLAERLGTVAAVQSGRHALSLRRSGDMQRGRVVDGGGSSPHASTPWSTSAPAPMIGIVVVTVGTDADSSVPSSRRTSANCFSDGRPAITGP